MNKNITFLLMLFFTLSTLKVCAQDSAAVLVFKLADNRELITSGVLEEEVDLKDASQEEVYETVGKTLTLLQLEGYASATTDSIIWKDDNIVWVYLKTGKLYTWQGLRVDSVPEEVLDKVGLKPSYYESATFSIPRIQIQLNKVLEYYENHGYPFASVRLANVQIEKEEVSAVLELKKGPLVRIDSIAIIGDPNVSEQYIANYIGIQEGDVYNESKLSKISTRIKEIAFLEQAQGFEVEFTDIHTTLYLFLKAKKANDFNGIVGFQPDATTGDVTITGDVSLQLRNSLGKGERLFANWKRLADRTQDLITEVEAPFLFNTSFGLEGGAKLYRRDTLFSTVTLSAGVQYAFNGGNRISAYIEQEASQLISTVAYATTTTLPEVADVTFLSYGLTCDFRDLDYRLNPTKGYVLTAKFGLGNKEIRKNSSLLPEVYDDVSLNTTQFEVGAEPMFYIPLGSRFTIKQRGQFSMLINEKIFRNEAFRIGGLKSLRGFDEESIFATSYAIYSVEPRFLLEENSYLFTFLDVAFYEDKSAATYIRDNPYGFGLGVSFQTKPGIFAISYALGAQRNNPILLRDGKIHFGFVNYF